MVEETEIPKLKYDKPLESVKTCQPKLTHIVFLTSDVTWLKATNQHNLLAGRTVGRA